MLVRRVGVRSKVTNHGTLSSLRQPAAQPQFPAATGLPAESPEKRVGITPSHALSQWVRALSAPNDLENVPGFKDIVGSRSLRVPLVTLQRALQQAEKKGRTGLSDRLPSEATLSRKLKYLEHKGITADDLDHWIWILSADNADARVERLVSSDRYKPIFVLFNVLQKDEVFRNPRSVIHVLEYAADNFCSADVLGSRTRPSAEPSLASRSGPLRVLDHRANMSPENFALLLRLLTHHCQRVWPMAIVNVAHLASQYIKNLGWAAVEPDKAFWTRAEKTYAARCHIFNYSLQLFEQPASHNPIAHMRFNWRAQRVMLALSGTFSRPLQIDRFGFRAIRRVLLGLAKSKDEKIVAARLSKTWPPYRQNWDGLDERRMPEDDLSRSVKAGIMMREAGYADDTHDLALGVLGGADLGESPYVQTRSLSPKVWRGRHAALNIYSKWAAQVKATRNAYEAWRCFQQPPKEGLEPNSQVYAEMFARLFAREVTLTPRTLPGDAKENLAFHDDNLSDFERARVQPPTVQQLYEQMCGQQLRPVGYCLELLVAHSPSLDMMEKYLSDGLVNREAVDAFMRLMRREPTAFTCSEASGLLARMPVRIFHACILAVCNMQHNRKSGLAPLKSKGKDLHFVRSAIKCTFVRLKTEPNSYVAPWHAILRALSRPNIAVSRDFSEPYDRRNSVESLQLFLEVYRQVQRRKGVDVVMFDRLCLVLRRVLSALEFEKVAQDSNEGRAIHTARGFLKAAFGIITRPATTSNERQERMVDFGQDLPPLFYRVNIVHLQNYIRTMGYLGDVDEMVRVVEWIVANWGTSTFEDARDPSHAHHQRAAEALIMFRAFAEAHLSRERMAELEKRMLRLMVESGGGCGGDSLPLWPTRFEAEAYANGEAFKDENAALADGVSGRRGHGDSARFWRRAKQYMRGVGPLEAWEDADLDRPQPGMQPSLSWAPIETSSRTERAGQSWAPAASSDLSDESDWEMMGQVQPAQDRRRSKDAAPAPACF